MFTSLSSFRPANFPHKARSSRLRFALKPRGGFTRSGPRPTPTNSVCSLEIWCYGDIFSLLSFSSKFYWGSTGVRTPAFQIFDPPSSPTVNLEQIHTSRVSIETDNLPWLLRSRCLFVEGPHLWTHFPNTLSYLRNKWHFVNLSLQKS